MADTQQSEDYGCGVSIGSVDAGYPCPKDETTLKLIEDKTGSRRHAGAWCPTCHTVWRELDEATLADLDALPASDQGEWP